VGSILTISLDGQVLDRWGQRGDNLGEFRGYPHGIWIDQNQDLYVAEVGADKALQKNCSSLNSFTFSSRLLGIVLKFI